MKDKSRCDISIHKDMRISIYIHKKNKNYSVTVQQKKHVNCHFADYLWIPLIDQPQSDIVVFKIITFHIYNIIVTKPKHRIGPNDIITFNE